MWSYFFRFPNFLLIKKKLKKIPKKISYFFGYFDLELACADPRNVRTTKTKCKKYSAFIWYPYCRIMMYDLSPRLRGQVEDRGHNLPLVEIGITQLPKCKMHSPLLLVPPFIYHSHQLKLLSTLSCVFLTEVAKVELPKSCGYLSSVLSPKG